MYRNYRIVVSIDGGGIKGLIPLQILSYIEKKLKNEYKTSCLQDFVDLYAGISTGAIIGGALMIQNECKEYLYTIDNIKELYLKRSNLIFKRDISARHKKNSVLKMVLDSNFGQFNIKDIKKNFLFLSYDLKKNSPFIFMDRMQKFRDIPLSKILLACTAVPNVFESVKIGNLELVDGGVYSKSPALLSYDYIKLYYPDDPIILLSFGTGSVNANKKDETEEESCEIHRKLKKISSENRKLIYYRFQPDITRASDEMDNTNPENLKNLKWDADNYISKNQKMFNEFFNFIKIKFNSNH